MKNLLLKSLTTFLLTYYEQLIITSFIIKLRKYYILQYSNEFILHSKYLNHSFHITIWILLIFACFLYSLLLFDIIGDLLGWKSGLLLCFLMIGWYLLVFFVFERCWRYFYDMKNHNDDNDNDNQNRVDKKDHKDIESERSHREKEEEERRRLGGGKEKNEVDEGVKPAETNPPSTLLTRMSNRLSVRLSGLFSPLPPPTTTTTTSEKHIIDQIMDDDVSVEIDEEEQAKILGGVVRRSYLLSEEFPGDGRRSMVEMSPRGSLRSSLQGSSSMISSNKTLSSMGTGMSGISEIVKEEDEDEEEEGEEERGEQMEK